MRRTSPVCLLLIIVSCGPQFKNETEELTYLRAVASPSPEQWRRRRELTLAVVEREIGKASELKWEPAIQVLEGVIDFVGPAEEFKGERERAQALIALERLTMIGRERPSLPRDTDPLGTELRRARSMDNPPDHIIGAMTAYEELARGIPKPRRGSLRPPDSGSSKKSAPGPPQEKILKNPIV